MTAFDKRSETGSNTSDAWLSHCIDNGIHYAYTGYENWNKSEGFMNAIKDEHVLGTYPYPSWSKIRYLPDWFIIDNLSNGCFVDTKSGSSNSMEKDAYEMYKEMASEKIQLDVMIAKSRNGSLYSFNVDDIKLMTVKEKVYYGIPVVDEKYFFPRNMTPEDYIKWKNKTGGSGTPFIIIDNFKEFEKTKMNTSNVPTSEIQKSDYTKHKEVSDKFIEFCKSTGREYAFCGVENWQRSESFLPALKKSKNQTCKLIKHFPDLMVVKPYKIFKERFGGSMIKFIGPDLKIEEDAFKMMQDLDCMGMGVMLVTFHNSELKYCPIQLANIKDIGTAYNGIPVFENRWAKPKKLKSIEYSEWMKKNNDDPFGFIEQKCFKKLEA